MFENVRHGVVVLGDKGRANLAARSNIQRPRDERPMAPVALGVHHHLVGSQTVILSPNEIAQPKAHPQ